MKTEFAHPRFTGERFDENTLPVEIARDLAAYESLIVDLAKHLYLLDHAERQRVPKGFTTSFHLAIERIDPGSAKPVLALVASGMLSLNGGESSYFEKARDLVADVIGAPEGSLPERFPKTLLAHFNQFGRSLRDGEILELPRASDKSNAVLTPERRKHLVLAADKVYEQEVMLTGSIGEADWEKDTFRLRLADGTQVTVPMPSTFHSNARQYGGRPRHQVMLSGVATYDSWDRLQKVIAVDALEVIKNYPLSSRMDDILQLRPGWHDGDGEAPDREAVTQIGEKLVTAYPEALPLPSIVPTQQGNLLLEWDAMGDPSLDIALHGPQADFHSFGDGEHEVEAHFPLRNDADWDALFAFLSLHVKQGSA